MQSYIRPDGSLATYYDIYSKFGKGPVYFTLTVEATPEDTEATDLLVDVSNEILGTLRLSDPDLNR